MTELILVQLPILPPGLISTRVGLLVPGMVQKFKTTDWRGMVKQQSITTDNTISVSGGSDKIKAYGSFGYLNNSGTIKGQSFERYSAKANVDITATNWLSFGNNINVSYSKQQFGQSNAGIATIGTPPGRFI